MEAQHGAVLTTHCDALKEELISLLSGRVWMNPWKYSRAHGQAVLLMSSNSTSVYLPLPITPVPPFPPAVAMHPAWGGSRTPRQGWKTWLHGPAQQNDPPGVATQELGPLPRPAQTFPLLASPQHALWKAAAAAASWQVPQLLQRQGCAPAPGNGSQGCGAEPGPQRGAQCPDTGYAWSRALLL